MERGIIKQAVSEYYYIPLDILLHPTRKRKIVQARQTAMYFANKITKRSSSYIGQRIGQKDHATVLHAYKTINNLLDTDKDYFLEHNELYLIIKDKIEQYNKKRSEESKNINNNKKYRHNKLISNMNRRKHYKNKTS